MIVPFSEDSLIVPLPTNFEVDDAALTDSGSIPS